MDEDCIFCKIVRGDIPSKKIYENDNFFSIFDVNPIAKGHSLVISKEHFETSLDLPDKVGYDLLDCIKQTILKLIDEWGLKGFNIINNNFEVAGQVVKHAHFHIIPRKKDDGLKVIG
jgi:histidine triad (HIT) family protein